MAGHVITYIYVITGLIKWTHIKAKLQNCQDSKCITVLTIMARVCLDELLKISYENSHI